MEFSSNEEEEEEILEHYADVEDDMGPPDDAEQGTSGATSEMHCIDHDVGTVQLTGTEMLTPVDGVVKGQKPYLSMEFESDLAAREFYNAYASRLGFGIRVARSRSERRKGVEVLVMKRFVCLKEGHHKKKMAEPTADKKKRKRLSIREGCPAMMEVVRRALGKWVVTKLVLEHTHVLVSQDQLRELQLRRHSGKYQEHENRLREVRQNVFGDGDAQCLLEYFKRMQAENAGFFYSMQVDTKNCVSNIVWVDARARIAYTYFGDAVYFDTTYSQNENMIPFAVFTGVNHHGDPIVFGCALVMDQTESAYSWLFETWLTAMYKRHPISFTTDQGKAITSAAAKVFPHSFHRFCRWRILSRCKKKLSDVYLRFPGLHAELRLCVNGTDTVEAFEINWSSMISKYDLRENVWLQSLYDLRHKWVPAYLTNSFFGELSITKRAESISRFYKRNFSAKVPVHTFVTRFDQEVESWHLKEAQKDLTLPSEQILKTDTVMEKQAASIFTRAAFEVFQVELVEALNHYAIKVQDGQYTKYFVEVVGVAHSRHNVYLSAAERRAWCDCCKFSFSGILCRHVLAVFILTGIILLPEHCITKRWTTKAKSDPESYERDVANENNCKGSPILRYNDIVRDALKCVEKGAASPFCFKVAKDMLQRALLQMSSFEDKLAKNGIDANNR